MDTYKPGVQETVKRLNSEQQRERQEGPQQRERQSTSKPGPPVARRSQATDTRPKDSRFVENTAGKGRENDKLHLVRRHTNTDNPGSAITGPALPPRKETGGNAGR